jgi:hypothetical protein
MPAGAVPPAVSSGVVVAAAPPAALAANISDPIAAITARRAERLLRTMVRPPQVNSSG